jgi:hypothetical protein
MSKHKYGRLVSLRKFLTPHGLVRLYTKLPDLARLAKYQVAFINMSKTLEMHHLWGTTGIGGVKNYLKL